MCFDGGMAGQELQERGGGSEEEQECREDEEEEERGKRSRGSKRL
jgi:hypothetical protein